MNWSLLQNSLLVAAATTVAAVVIGLVAALCVTGLAGAWRSGAIALAVVALVMPPFLVANCWLDLLGSNGLLKPWLPLDLFSLGGVVLLLTLLYWPITMFLTLGAWRRLQSDQLEADARVRGMALLRGLLLPSARTALAQSAVLTLVLALNHFAIPAILQVKVLPAEVWVNFSTAFDYGAALRLSWPMIVLPLLALIWLGRNELPWPRAGRGVDPGLFRQQLGNGWFAVVTVITALAIGLSVVVPLLELVVSASTWRELSGAAAAGLPAALNSVVFATATATCVVAFGCLLARRGNSLAARIAWLPLLVPGVFLGVALIWLLNRPASAFIYQSFAVVIIGLAVRYFAVGWTGATQAFAAADRDLVDAGRVHGATGWRLFRIALWPQVAPQLTATWYVVYLLCLWDVETLVLIIPPGGETLALRVFNLLHYGHAGQVNALCLLLLALAVAPLLLWSVAADVRRLTSKQKEDGASLRRLLPVLACAALLVGCGSKPTDSSRGFTGHLFSRVEIIGSRGTGPGQFLKPRALTFDRDDNLFVADMTGRVQKFAPDGRYLLHWQMEETDKGKPKGMCRDEQGNIVVLEPHYSRVNHFTPDGKLVHQWGTHGTNDGQLAFPRSIAINARGEAYVSEYGMKERVQRFAAKGAQWLASADAPGQGAGQFNRAEGIGLAPDGTLFVADSCNHRVQVFSADLKFVREFGRAGQGSGELSYPYDVQVDAGGNVFVCEFGNSRVQVFDAMGKSVGIIGRAGAASGEFANPWSIALDSQGNLYVADSQNHRVQKFVRRALMTAESSSRSSAPFPLTPALSRGERENRIPSFVLTRPPLSSMATETAAEAEGCPNAERLAHFPPLPEGEGRGEGEGSRLYARFIDVARVACSIPHSALRIPHSP